MRNRGLCTVLLMATSTLALGQTIDYGPRGIATTLPMTTAIAPQITPPAPTIPTSPSSNPLVITPPMTTIPLTPAVPPPIEPSPTERMAAEHWTHTTTLEETHSAGEFFNPGVVSTPAIEDGTRGRSIGEIARERRRCTPNVAHTFTNDDFAADTNGVPTLVENVCASSTPQ